MTPYRKRVRIKRVLEMQKVLDTLFPTTRIHLHYGNTWELLVAVVLSAQCTDVRVNQVTKTLFTTYKTIEEYARAPRAEFEQAIFSTGFYRAKARHIQEAARAILTHHNGVVPGTLTELVTLPGVGRKTANVILSNAFGADVGIAVDTHVRRFAIRFDLSDYTDPKRIERDLMEVVPKDAWWLFHHKLIEYGRAYCPARPHECTMHPLTRVYPKAQTVWPKAH